MLIQIEYYSIANYIFLAMIVVYTTILSCRVNKLEEKIEEMNVNV